MGRILEKESSDVRKTVFRNQFVLIPEDIDVHDGKIKFLYVHSSSGANENTLPRSIEILCGMAELSWKPKSKRYGNQNRRLD